MSLFQIQYEQLRNTIEWRTFAHRLKEMANFACQICRASGPNVTLNVHHHAYESERLPWEYGPGECSVLCKPCHEELHIQLQNFRRHVFSQLSPRVFQILNGALAVGLEQHDPILMAHAVANLIATPGAVVRFGSNWK